MAVIRPTSDQATGYVWFGQHCLNLLRQSGRPGTKAFRDGRLLVICKYNHHHADLIVLSRGDFATHPRSGSVAKIPYYDNQMNLYTLTGIDGGGWRQDGETYEELATRWGFPLVNDDNGTFLVTADEQLEVAWAGKAAENYGNIWWQGQGDNPPVLSWRGPPSVQFSLPGDLRIPGLSQVETTVSGREYYTTFGCYLYQGGAYLCHGPQWFADDELATLVVGACYATTAAGKQWLVAICITRMAAGSFSLQVWRSCDVGKNWQILNEFPATGRARVPAFIAADGRAFVYDGVRYTIDTDVSVVTAGTLATQGAIPAAISGSRTVSGPGGYGSDYHYLGKRYCWPAMDADGRLVYATAVEDAVFTTTGDSSGTPATITAPVYRGSPATQVTISVIGTGTGGPCTVGGSGVNVILGAAVNGSYCQAVWSGVDCYKGLEAVKRVPDCNGAYSVSVTIQPQGLTATYTQSGALPDIVVSGPADMVLGSQYAAANTIGDVEWSVSKGQIDPDTGVITSMEGAECGTATITVTDRCGRSGSLFVRCPEGQWITDPSSYACGQFFPGSAGSGQIPKIIGNRRYYYQIVNDYFSSYDQFAPNGVSQTCFAMVQEYPVWDGTWYDNVVSLVWGWEVWSC